MPRNVNTAPISICNSHHAMSAKGVTCAKVILPPLFGLHS